MTNEHQAADDVPRVAGTSALRVPIVCCWLLMLVTFSAPGRDSPRNTGGLDYIGLAKLGRYVTFGASPRASINLVLAARALAFVRGRDYAVPRDLTDLVLDVFRHRLVLSYEALTDDVTADSVLTQVMAAVPVPDVPQGRR